MNNTVDNRCILLFVKYPKRGDVKTRLALELQRITAEDLYRAFVDDSLSLLEHLGIPVAICYSPEGAKMSFAAWLGKHRAYIPQQGATLGKRLEGCFHYAFSQGFEQVIALGTDSPDLPAAFITEAFSQLETCDSVLGPSRDGGYYLIGFRKKGFLPEAFDGIDWSTERVFPETMEKLTRAGQTIHVLPSWSDVDTVDDLKQLFQRGCNSTFKTSRTMSLLLIQDFS